MCLPRRCVATHAAWTTENTAPLLLRAFSSRMFLRSRYLTVNYSGFQVSCHDIFLFVTVSRRAVGVIRPSVQWVSGALSLGVKPPGSKLTIQFRICCLLVCCKKRKIKICKTIILPVILYGWETLSLIWETEGVWERGAEDIWTTEELNNKRLEKTT
jgi:hypothetical protein